MTGFSAGGHLTSTAGTHFDAGDPALSEWPRLLEIWLRARGLLARD
jgi:hypothetical protein